MLACDGSQLSSVQLLDMFRQAAALHGASLADIFIGSEVEDEIRASVYAENAEVEETLRAHANICLLYTSPSPRDA
eukprot:4649075-Heterocapsa_arctica.AAC.1